MHRLSRIIMALVFITSMLVAAGVQAAPSQAGVAQNYLVLYKGNAVATDAITKAGGTIVASYDKIGVAVVQSSNAGFAAAARKDSRVEGVSATAGFGIKVHDDVADAGAVANTPVIACASGVCI
jgi:lantibiotic leader peptide-processing serine protease